jgi:energy-coupling factor transporter ATP-binding protein EcfA2
MSDPEVSEREETVTRVGSTGSGKQTVTRTTGSVAPMASRAKSTVWLAVGVVDLVLALDFVFKLLASTAVGFVGFIASVATALAAPFRGVMATSVTTGHYANWPNVVGIVVYLIAAWIVVSLIGITATRRPPQPDRI